MITITNDNIYRSEFGVAYLQSIEDCEQVIEYNLTDYISEEVEFGESVTLERLFELIKLNQDVLSDIYKSCMGGFSLTPFLDEIDDIPTKKTDIKYLEFHWQGDKNDFNLNITPLIHGIGVQTVEDKEEEIIYSIGFSPLNNLKYLNVRINPVLSIYEYGDKMSKTLDLGDKLFTLHDLFYSLLYEISFYGDPITRDEKLKELDENVAQSQSEYENGDFVEIDDIVEYFEKNDTYLVKYKKLKSRLDEELSSDIENVEPLKNCLIEKLKLYDKIERSKAKNMTKFYKKLTDVEFNLQLLYGVDEDQNYHKFWETPRCTCPKIDNSVRYPNGNYVKSETCPIHK